MFVIYYRILANISRFDLWIALQMAHGQWNETWSPTHKYDCECPHAIVHDDAVENREKLGESIMCVCVDVRILCICIILSCRVWKNFYCVLPPECSVTNYLESKMCSMILCYIFIPGSVLLAVSVHLKQEMML